MLKRTLIAVAVVALLATSAQAFGPDPVTDSAGDERGFKIEPIEMDVFWPFVEFKALDLCVIPIKMEIGIMVQVHKCHKRKIVLKQVDCADISKGGGDFPCYKGCEDVNIRTNFPIKLGLDLNKTSAVIDKWEAYYDGDDFVDPAGSDWKKVTVCVKAWKANLFAVEASGEAGDKIQVGTVAITVKPNV
jgi:hypothetical protein